VTSRHGKGNYGHPGVTNLPMRMDINSDFRRILTHAGFAVRTVRTTAVSEEPSPGMVRRMPEIAGRRVAAFDQLFYADGRLAIVCRVELPDDYLITAPEAGEYTENINEFLHSSCRRESSHTTAWLTAGTSSQAARRFGLDPSAPLLEWEEVYYDMYDMKIGYVKNYFHPEIMDLSLLLKF
jgi:GntR family transcriptional regulator